MTARTTIDYEALTQDALRGVVRAVLSRAAKLGLPGDHHFYIAFHTLAPGVTLSKRLREKYPREMIIVLQHRFWDLSVTDDRFDVKLTFDGIPERIIVPFAALKVFSDPSVGYGLQFGELDSDHEAGGEPGFAPHLVAEPDEDQPGSKDGEDLAAARVSTGRSSMSRRPRIVKRVREREPERAAAAALASNAPHAAEQSAKDLEPLAASGAEIVRLDAFRKK